MKLPTNTPSAKNIIKSTVNISLKTLTIMHNIKVNPEATKPFKIPIFIILYFSLNNHFRFLYIPY